MFVSIYTRYEKWEFGLEFWIEQKIPTFWTKNSSARWGMDLFNLESLRFLALLCSHGVKLGYNLYVCYWHQ